MTQQPYAPGYPPQGYPQQPPAPQGYGQPQYAPPGYPQPQQQFPPQQPQGYPPQQAPHGGPGYGQFPGQQPGQAPQPEPVQGSIEGFYSQPSTGGGKSLAFEQPGARYIARVARTVQNSDIEHSTKVNSTELDYFRDGTPKMVMKVPVLVAPDQTRPDGQGQLYVRGGMRDELSRAMQEAGSASQVPEAGALIDITFTGTRPGAPGYSPTKVYSITYTLPEGVAPVQPGQQPQQVASVPQAQQPAPAAAPPAAPQQQYDPAAYANGGVVPGYGQQQPPYQQPAPQQVAPPAAPPAPPAPPAPGALSPVPGAPAQPGQGFPPQQVGAPPAPPVGAPAAAPPMAPPAQATAPSGYPEAPGAVPQLPPGFDPAQAQMMANLVAQAGGQQVPGQYPQQVQG